MDDITPESAADYFCRQDPHWSEFVDGFRQKREAEFNDLNQLDNINTLTNEKDYWIKMGRVLAYQEIYAELNTLVPIGDTESQ